MLQGPLPVSLTSLLADRDVRMLFKETFNFKPFDIGAELKAPPVTKRYSMVGSAFDYLARWWLKRKFPRTNEKPWVAEAAVNVLRMRAGELVVIKTENGSLWEPVDDWLDENGKLKRRPGDNVQVSHATGVTPEKKRLASLAARTLESAKSAQRDYLRTGQATDGMFEAVIGLANLDVVFRAGITDQVGTTPDAGDVSDLRSLWRTLETGGLRNIGEPLALNPTFGPASGLVGGADADIVANGLLVDIKTTKKGRFERQYFDQLVGYWALSIIGDINSYDGRIDSLGIYFSRHGVLSTLPLPEISNVDLNRFLAKFKQMAADVTGLRPKGD